VQFAPEFPVEINLSPIEDPDRVLVAAAIRDVTDRKRIEAELIVARDAAEAISRCSTAPCAGLSQTRTPLMR
jgi:hypothetical protein